MIVAEVSLYPLFTQDLLTSRFVTSISCSILSGAVKWCKFCLLASTVHGRWLRFCSLALDWLFLALCLYIVLLSQVFAATHVLYDQPIQLCRQNPPTWGISYDGTHGKETEFWIEFFYWVCIFDVLCPFMLPRQTKPQVITACCSLHLPPKISAQGQSTLSSAPTSQAQYMTFSLLFIFI